MRVITLVFICFILAFAACKFVGGKRITGNKKVTTEQRTITDFDAIDVSGSFNVYISQGASYSVKVEAEENLLPYIQIENDGGELDVHFKKNYNIRAHNPIKVFVTAPNYTRLAVAGSGDIISETRISNPSKLDIDIAGSGDVKLDVDAPSINTEIGGSGSALLKGTTRTVNASIAGSGEFKAYDLLSETTEIDIAGSGDAEVFASKQLTINVAGSGNVNYKGSPNVSKSIAGSGNIKKVG